MQPGQSGGPYANLPSLPALSPPTPLMSTAPQYPNQGGQHMARSASHNMVLVTPDESSIQVPPPKLPPKSNSSPFLTNHSEAVYSHLMPEKSMHPNGQYSNHDGNSRPRQMVPQYSIPPDAVDSGRMSTSNGASHPSQFVWQQQNGNYTPNSIATSMPAAVTDRPPANQLQQTNSEESMRSTENMVSQNNPYVTLSAASPAVLSTLPKPTRSSKDYFDGIVLSDKSAQQQQQQQPAMDAAGPIVSPVNVSFAPALSAQKQDAIQRPVFTMPFGNSKPEQSAPENTTTETSQITGQWQRW